ncbi:cyclic AMP-dependent transcription factor ATF-1 isoform X2 [Gouania willdenowi]|uniref:cyclic AMP-dependent transcription factor ATF-1 isoform X2 n=1 Tax=Gouania willdenowi TaxID=441366 RepID=UPI0010569959|nr:cyclic AMP-dependent transcription factor ATF-1-like isoform X2 [Gouania willdenowi]
MSLDGSSVTLVQLPGGQVQVQGVIQSVIQSPQGQSAQGQETDSEDSQDSSDSGATPQNTRELLARRPSYRKILNELSSEEVTHVEEKDHGIALSGGAGATVPTTQIYQTSSGQYITISANGTIQLANPPSESIQGPQAVAMANSGGAQPGTTILQYAQTPDGQQILVPSNQVVVQAQHQLLVHEPVAEDYCFRLISSRGAGGEMQAYQIRTTPTSLSQTVVMSSPVGFSQSNTADPTVKREIRLAKNREAARECRRKKKEYVKCLENRVAVLENQNKTLIEELKTLKDIYCVKSG